MNIIVSFLRRFNRSRIRSAAAVLPVVLFFLPGCRDRNHLGVELNIESAVEREPRSLNLRAHVNQPSSEFTYRWFSKTGECNPQRSESPTTTFTFGEGQTQDRVVVEVWLGSALAGQSELTVNLTPAAPAKEVSKRKPHVQIELTDTPPYDPVGGPTTRAHIGGILTGDVEASLVVILYARAGKAWFVQPDPSGAKTFLRSDHSFSNWTHTGSDYAVLVARSSYTPLIGSDALPLNDEEIVAHLIVPGEKAEPSTPP